MCDLTGATVEDIITLIEGNLAHARFDGARLYRTMIIKTPMTGVSLAGASVEHCIFMDCEATQADFRGMRAFQSIFLKLIAPRSDFSERCGIDRLPWRRGSGRVAASTKPRAFSPHIAQGAISRVRALYARNSTARSCPKPDLSGAICAAGRDGAVLCWTGRR